MGQVEDAQKRQAEAAASAAAERERDATRRVQRLAEQQVLLEEFVAMPVTGGTARVSVWQRREGKPSASLAWNGAVRKTIILDHVADGWVCGSQTTDYDVHTETRVTYVVSSEPILYHVEQRDVPWDARPFYPGELFTRTAFRDSRGHLLDSSSLVRAKRSGLGRRTYLELREANALLTSGIGVRDASTSELLARMIGCPPIGSVVLGLE